MARGPESFPRAVRLRRRSEFLRAQSRGQQLRGRLFVLVVLRESPGSRLGITVSRRVGSAVVRNRIRRVVRELYRRERASFPPGDVVVIARAAAAEADGEALRSELRRLVARSAKG